MALALNCGLVTPAFHLFSFMFGRRVLWLNGAGDGGDQKHADAVERGDGLEKYSVSG